MLTGRNVSAGATFVLLGFSEFPPLKVPLFLLFLAIYTVTVFGNLGMILIIRVSPKLHTPMYFFLSHLSFLDLCYSSVNMKTKTVSFLSCMIQFFIGCTFVITEVFMLTVMAYDRFVAVCNPLLYTVAMSPKLCALLVAGTYIWGSLCSLTLTYCLLELSYCGSTINHYCCEFSALLSVSCSDTHFSLMVMLVISTFNEACSLLVILTSYAFIVVTIIKIPSKGVFRKAFSTCASHLTAITIFHGILLVLYCVPKSKGSWILIKVATLFYTIVIPMLNPLIYSVRNKDVKEAVKMLIHTKVLSHSM
ncbi:olfactory receptor 1165-like [Cynocephalus volans]|uniref:olfactory receptor 1165-like n=1 Tax=Cynocephalus volans TaxID=110931 RepID=UPI002FC5DF72